MACHDCGRRGTEPVRCTPRVRPGGGEFHAPSEWHVDLGQEAAERLAAGVDAVAQRDGDLLAGRGQVRADVGGLGLVWVPSSKLTAVSPGLRPASSVTVTSWCLSTQ
jgi:hypothetical protein